MQRQLAYAAAAVLMAALLVLALQTNKNLPPEATAATLVDGDKNVWARNVGFQMAEDLRSGNPEIRDQALFQTMYFAQHRKDAHLTAAVPALLDIYRSDMDDQHRIAAAVALHAIGDSGAMQGMRSWLRMQTSQRVQAVSIALLHDFYGSESFENSPAEAEMAEVILAEIRAARTQPVIASR